VPESIIASDMAVVPVPTVTDAGEVSVYPVKVPVVIVGDVPNTSDPDPVSSVTAVAKLADDGVAKNVATPVPRPLTPVDIGRPVALVNVPEVGVPKIGVTKVGEVANTTLPVPVELVNVGA
jgi:hypothetical protein